jgi:hypothetical protein
MGLSQADVTKRLSQAKASAENIEAKILADPTPLPLVLFRAKGPEPSRGKGGGVTAQLQKGAGTYPHAFLATMPSGHRGVFERKSRSRLPIRELKGPSAWFVGTKYAKAAEGLAREQFPDDLKAAGAFD